MSNSAENAWCARSRAAASSSPTTIAAKARLAAMGTSSLLQRSLFRGFFSSSLLLGPGTRERVVQAVVPFVAGVLEYRTRRLLPQHLGGPGSRPRRRVIDGELIAERVFGHARETYRQPHVLACALERELVREIRRFDNQRLALPAAAVTSRPLADVCRQVRTAVERNDTDVVEHLRENHHVARSLH